MGFRSPAGRCPVMSGFETLLDSEGAMTVNKPCVGGYQLRCNDRKSDRSGMHLDIIHDSGHTDEGDLIGTGPAARPEQRSAPVRPCVKTSTRTFALCASSLSLFKRRPHECRVSLLTHRPCLAHVTYGRWEIRSNLHNLRYPGNLSLFGAM